MTTTPAKHQGKRKKIRDRIKEYFAKFDWSSPTGRVERYSYAVPPLMEFTSRPGFGIGLGFAVWDVWMGWPRKAEA